MFQRNPNLSIFATIFIARLCYAFWSWIKPSVILPSHTINYTKKHILNISKALVMISSILLTLNLSLVTRHSSLVLTPVILVIDQSRSMAHDDLTPSRRDIALSIADNIYSTEIGDTPYNGSSRWNNNTTIITYAQTPHIYKLKDINSLRPIITQQWSSALGDARLIAYDLIWSWLDHKPIVITITDGGSNTWYDLSQTASILQTRAQLWIVWLSTGTQIVAYDDSWRWLTSTMDAALLSSLADSWHRYPIPDNTSVSWVIDRLWQDLYNEYYQLWPLTFDLWPIWWLLLWLWIVWRTWVYISRKSLRPF
jgi:uncharacterized protein YegL